MGNGLYLEEGRRQSRPPNWANRVALVGGIVAILATLLTVGIGFDARLGGLESGLDRNCRVLVTLQADVRYLITQSTPAGPFSGEEQLRRIFRSVAPELCG